MHLLKPWVLEDKLWQFGDFKSCSCLHKQINKEKNNFKIVNWISPVFIELSRHKMYR
jgi:hypothetical protein